MRAQRKGQAGLFALHDGIVGEARLVERAFGLGPCALTEVMVFLQDRLASAETRGDHVASPTTAPLRHVCKPAVDAAKAMERAAGTDTTAPLQVGALGVLDMDDTAVYSGYRIPAETMGTPSDLYVNGATTLVREFPPPYTLHRLDDKTIVTKTLAELRPIITELVAKNGPDGKTPAATEPAGSGPGQHSNPDLKIGRRIASGLGVLIALVILWGIRRRARIRKATGTNFAPGSKESAS